MSEITPFTALLELEPSFFDSLTEAERLVVGHMAELWLRPEQRVPAGRFRTFSFSGARGWGKSFGLAHHFNSAVESGLYTAPAFMGPNVDRVQDVVVKALIEAAPPWFMPERYAGGLRWPNGVIAEIHTAEVEGRTRGSNFDAVWLSEIVDWQSTTREEAFSNIFTATRIGAGHVFCDTTSRGQNPIILKVMRMSEADPAQHRRVTGTTFDNPLLTHEYLKSVCSNYAEGSRRFREEIMGEIFAEAAGALWQQDWLDVNRREIAPTGAERTLVAVDPAITTREGSDATGIVVGSLGRDGHIYVLADMTGRWGPSEWVKLAVDRCALDACGIVVETNRGGMGHTDLIRAHCDTRGFRVDVLPKEAPFPPRIPGRVFIREIHTTSSKHARAEGPADLGRAGRVHHVGVFAELEAELTTWEQGSRVSPNRLDAHAYLISELSGITRATPANPSEDFKAAAAGREYMRTIEDRSERTGLRLTVRGGGGRGV